MFVFTTFLDGLTLFLDYVTSSTSTTALQRGLYEPTGIPGECVRGGGGCSPPGKSLRNDTPEKRFFINVLCLTDGINTVFEVH